MKHYLLSINSNNELWNGYSTISPFLDENGNDIETPMEMLGRSHLYYEDLKFDKKSNKTPPVDMIDNILLIKKDINNIKILEDSSLDLIPVFNLNGESEFLAFNIKHSIHNCVNWEKSNFEPWPSERKIKDWEHPRGQIFYKPVLYKSKIPTINIFRIIEWPDDNIMISETFKNKLLQLNFNHNFLKFTDIELT